MWEEDQGSAHHRLLDRLHATPAVIPLRDDVVNRVKDEVGIYARASGRTHLIPPRKPFLDPFPQHLTS
jgi:hypothetical protein